MDDFIKVDELLNYMGYDVTDEMIIKNAERAIVFADGYLKGSIGTDYPRNDARAKELGLIIAADVYENRGLTQTISGNVRKLVNDISWQLRLELQRGVFYE